MLGSQRTECRTTSLSLIAFASGTEEEDQVIAQVWLAHASDVLWHCPYAAIPACHPPSLSHGTKTLPPSLQFHKAAEDGDEAKVRELLESGVNVSCYSPGPLSNSRALPLLGSATDPSGP